MAEVIKPKNAGTKLLFKNPILERLTRTHIAIPLCIFFTFAFCLLFWSVTHTTLPVWLTIMMFVAGFILFTWVEYIVHRYIFHMSTVTQVRENIQYMIHGVHHEFPKDKDRLAMPTIKRYYCYPTPFNF